PHHAHLVCLPVAVDLHHGLEREHDARDGAELGAIRTPYVYVDGIDAQAGTRRRTVYVARSAAGRASLGRFRFRPLVAAEIGGVARADWRAPPSGDELATVLHRFARYSETREALA